MITTTSIEEETPLRQDGTRFPFVIISMNGDGEQVVTAADSNTELLDSIIPGYGDLPDGADGVDAATISRYDHAVGVAAALQASLASQASERGDFDPNTESEDVLTAIFQDKTEPFTGLVTPGGERTHNWLHKVPLVLISTDYQPFTTLYTPTGRVIWIRPETETSYLESLAAIGFIEYLTAENTAV